MPLKLVQRHGSENWYMRGTIGGRRVDESTGTSIRSIAEKVKAAREDQLFKREIYGDSATRTFGEAALSYQSANGDDPLLVPILKYFGPKKLVAQIGQHDIEKCAEAIANGKSPATKNRQVFTPISAVLHHAAKQEWRSKPAIARPPQPTGRVRWLTEVEAERLIGAAPAHLKPLVIFLFATGCRISEALYLDWREVDLERAHVTILGPDDGTGTINTKNNEARGIPLHPRAQDALRALPHRKGAVFRRPMKGRKPRPGKEDERTLGEPYESRDGKGGGQIKTAWKTMCTKAKISNFTPHDCRHTWATWHYRENKDLAALMKLGGWKSYEMVLRYAHVNSEDLAPSVFKIWGGTKPRVVE
jgi:integrase